MPKVDTKRLSDIAQSRSTQSGKKDSSTLEPITSPAAAADLKLISTFTDATATPACRAILIVLRERCHRFSEVDEICKLANVSRASWYKQLRNPSFSAYLESQGLWYPALDATGRRLCRFLSSKENWSRTFVELGNLSGISDFDRVLKRHLDDQAFLKIITEIGYPYWMSNLQKRVTSALLDPACHSLTWDELSIKIGNSRSTSGLRFKLDVQENVGQFAAYLENELDFHLWMSLPQRRLYNQLRTEAGRAQWLSQGIQSFSSGSSRITIDERFTKACEKFDVYLWMNHSQRKILNGLQDRSINFASAEDFSEVTGAYIYRSIRDERFMSVLDTKYDFQSWMTWSQRRIYFAVRDIAPNTCVVDRLRINKIPVGAWYAAIKVDKFKNLMIHKSIPLSLGREVNGTVSSEVRQNWNPHSEVFFITSAQERAEYLELDKWDLRCLFREYPRGANPGQFQIDFTIIKRDSLRVEIKNVYTTYLTTHSPTTIVDKFRHLARFMVALIQLFPSLASMKEITQAHTCMVVERLGVTRHTSKMVAETSRTFERLSENDGTYDANAFFLDDLPKESSRPNPRPMDIRSMEVLDAYLQHETFAALEQGIAPSPLSIEEWNAFIILRHLGLRSSDIRHLIAIGPDRALQRDADGDPIVYVSHRNNKTKIDLRIPIPHLNGLGGDKNPVLSAIERQIPIAVNRGKSPDGRIYLFNRCISRGRDAQSVEPITSDQLSKSAKKVSAFLNLGSADGPSTLLPIIFRHTCLTELAEAGVQIEKIAKFAGHAKIGSTEFYYGLGQPWRKPLPPLPSTVRLDSALDDAIKASDKKPTPLEYLIQIELSDSVCESVITGKSCIAMRCLACPYKELTPAHLPLIERVVNEYERHVSQAKSFGLSEKVKEFSAILQFNRLALQFLLQGKNFRGERDIPNFHEKEQS